MKNPLLSILAMLIIMLLSPQTFCLTKNQIADAITRQSQYKYLQRINEGNIVDFSQRGTLLCVLVNAYQNTYVIVCRKRVKGSPFTIESTKKLRSNTMRYKKIEARHNRENGSIPYEIFEY